MAIDDRLRRQIVFLTEIDKLKSIIRQNALADGSRRENSGEHSWHFAMMAMLLSEYAPGGGIDGMKVVKMALIHDLVEIDAGDTFVYDTAAQADQSERERAAADRIFGLLPADQAAELRALWDEFEAAESAEAKFAKAIDRLGPLLLNYHSGGAAWRRHGIGAARIREVNFAAIGKGALELMEFVEGIIDDAEARGLTGPEA